MDANSKIAYKAILDVAEYIKILSIPQVPERYTRIISDSILRFASNYAMSCIPNTENLATANNSVEEEYTIWQKKTVGQSTKD